MSSNFLTFNPPNANQESDAAYSVDAARSGGLVTNQLVPSPLLNKALHQPTIMAAALGQALSNKGFTVSDADQNALAVVLANLLTTADYLPGQVLLSASIASTQSGNTALHTIYTAVVPGGSMGTLGGIEFEGWLAVSGSGNVTLSFTFGGVALTVAAVISAKGAPNYQQYVNVKIFNQGFANSQVYISTTEEVSTAGAITRTTGTSGGPNVDTTTDQAFQMKAINSSVSTVTTFWLARVRLF